MKKYTRLIIASAIFLCMLAVDIILKWYTFHNIQLYGYKEFIPYFISLTYVQNPGMAWGIKMPLWILITCSIAMAIVLVWALIAFHKRSLFLTIGLSLTLAGAVGNLIDRVALGYVVDMLNFEFIDFPICNFADYCVSVGGAIIVIFIVFMYRPEKEENAKQLATEGDLTAQTDAQNSHQNATNLEQNSTQTEENVSQAETDTIQGEKIVSQAEQNPTNLEQNSTQDERKDE